MPSPQASVDLPRIHLVPKPPRSSHKWRWIFTILLVLALGLIVWIRIAIGRAQPILRTKIVETLSARFHSRVERSDLNVWVANGLHVQGKGLKIFGLTDPNPFAPGVQPLIEVGEFDFQSDARSLLRERIHISTVHLSGLAMNIPP